MNILYDERVDGVLPQVDRSAFLAVLQHELPDLVVLHTEEDLRPYECDGLSAYRIVPMLVVLPERIEQVTAFMKLCHHHETLPPSWRACGCAWRRYGALWRGIAA